MVDDIETRLRGWSYRMIPTLLIFDEAADEIEGLRADRDRWQQAAPEGFAYELGWVALGETLGDDDGCEAARAIGEAIVGCEEMQAMKAVMRHLAARQATEVQAPTVDVLRLLGLPDLAIEWVLS